jgi:anti-anti-sigma regulatory factor
MLDVKIHPLLANGNQRVVLEGRLDTNTYGALDDRLTLVLPHGGWVKADGSEGLLAGADLQVRSVFRVRKLLEARGGKVLVANAQPQVQKVFDIVKAVPLSEIFRSVEEADAYLDRIQKKLLAKDEDD